MPDVIADVEEYLDECWQEQHAAPAPEPAAPVVSPELVQTMIRVQAIVDAIPPVLVIAVGLLLGWHGWNTYAIGEMYGSMACLVVGGICLLAQWV